jgi:oligoendopeptidase F
MVYAHHPDPGLRAAAYQELYRVYGDDGPVLGQMFQTMVRDFSSENIGLRGHEAPASVRHLDNDLPNAVVGSLLNVCRERGTLFQRFFRLKARMLGHPKLRRYDIYAPTAAGEKTYTFAEAWNLVRDAFADFDPRLADLAGRVIRDRRLDADVRSGKRDGAFCASLAPGDTPWVLQNFQGEARDVATLAHELGHAVHALLAADHSILTYHSALPLAENASTFGEMLLVDRLLAQETDPAVRRDLLFRQMDDAYATIGRQAFFSLFEEKAHAMVMAGATVDELAKEYQRNLDDQFGSAVEVAPEFQWEWVSIPHFYHVPFYVYAYSFGQLLVFALYREYRKDPQAFRPRYLDILKAGGAAAPMTVLSRAGLDISKADFWRGGFQVVEELVDKLEALV